MRNDYPRKFLKEVEEIASRIPLDSVEKTVEGLVQLRAQGGRLFFLGVGGSAANASHAVNDFRKICGMECYAPTDNVSELSARINDEGWESCFSEFLRGSRLTAKDAVFVLSVGGGNEEKKVSMNIVAAVRYAKEMGAKVFGIVGRDGGFTKRVADGCLVIPTMEESRVTFHAESFQSVLLHLLVSDPRLKQQPAKWESVR